jgi:tRNA(His) 5'-end guanylyltransferase
MKGYEAAEAMRRLLPVCVRLDGKAFHTFTRGLPRPYDERLSRLMVETTRHLVAETNARIGYTQSDEISLVLYSSDPKSQIFLDGRVQKLTSILASMATAAFHRHLPDFVPEKAGALPLFDCRVWNVPTLDEAVNTLIWRELDATKNSISMAAHAHFPHGRVHGLDGAQMQELLFREKGINWNDFPAFFKRGTYVQRRRVLRPFSAAEIEQLPPKHAARTNPDLVVERAEVRAIELPPLARVVNRVAVVFEGADPVAGAP